MLWGKIEEGKGVESHGGGRYIVNKEVKEDSIREVTIVEI